MKRFILLLLAAILGLTLTRWDVSSFKTQETNMDEFILKEITVTAVKRQENLQTVPRSMAVITSDDLTMRQSSNVQDMLNAAAGNTGTRL